MTNRELLDAKITEADWERTVIDMAHAYGWTVAGFRPGRTANGWRTPVKADGTGWPDLFLVKDRQAIAAELKSGTGRLAPVQQVWIDLLRAIPGITAVIWRPSDFEQVKTVLSGGER